MENNKTLIRIPKDIAKQRYLPRYFTGRPCKRGHIAERIVSNSACVECERDRWRRYNRENPHIRKKYAIENKDALDCWRRQYDRDNADKINAQKRAAYAKSPEKHRERRKKYYYDNKRDQNNKNTIWRQKNLEHLKEYYLLNKHEYTHRCAVRRSRKLLATPIWLTESQLSLIKEKYKQADLLNKTTDQKHHVDHIIPLQGKTVCGLHVPWNLQVILALDNLKKNNKLLVDDAI